MSRRSVHSWITSAAVASGGLIGGSGFAAEPSPSPAPPAAKPAFTFGTLKSLSADTAKPRLAAWLKSTGKFDQAKFDAVWANENRTVADRTLESVSLGLPEVSKLIVEAKDPVAPAPVEVPALLKDEKLDPFVKANVAAAYAKSLAGRRVYEEALETIKGIPAEQVVDPAAFYFYKAVAEHALMQREAAVSSIARLLDDVIDAPDRYRVTATLMFFDLQGWSKDPKDLSNIEKLMDNSGRRLDLARAGNHTQDIQKKIVFRLDEKIKELEAQAKNPGGA